MADRFANSLTSVGFNWWLWLRRAKASGSPHFLGARTFRWCLIWTFARFREQAHT
jgi:hypothetical protein